MKSWDGGLGKEMAYVTDAFMACFFGPGFFRSNSDLENFSIGILGEVR